jgi:mannitol/fructose-specific phosphotransferase system IIA component (Ntr-type)
VTQTLANFTSPDLIIPELRSRDACSVVAELCSVLSSKGRVGELLPFYNAVITREQLGSTATSTGWALPHARCKELAKVCFAMGRPSESMTWFGESGPGVNMVFLIVVPEAEAGTYLSLISGLARLSQDRNRSQRMLHAQDTQSIFEVLEQIPIRQPRNAPALF